MHACLLPYISLKGGKECHVVRDKPPLISQWMHDQLHGMEKSCKNMRQTFMSVTPIIVFVGKLWKSFTCDFFLDEFQYSSFATLGNSPKFHALLIRLSIMIFESSLNQRLTFAVTSSLHRCFSFTYIMEDWL